MDGIRRNVNFPCPVLVGIISGFSGGEFRYFPLKVYRMVRFPGSDFEAGDLVSLLLN